MRKYLLLGLLVGLMVFPFSVQPQVVVLRRGAGGGGGSFPVNGVLDNFNRTDQGPPPSASWSARIFTTDTQFKVASNVLIQDANGAGNYWNTSFNANQEAYITGITGLADGTEIWMRIAGPDTAGVDGYVINIYSGASGVRVFRIDDGSYTQLGATISQSFTNGDSFGAAMSGDTITIYYKVGAGAWASIGTRTDATYTAGGFIGVRAEVLAGDDFGGGSL